MSKGAAIAGAASSVLGPAISGITNAFIAKRQRRHEELMTDKQYKQMQQERDYMNWYNSPLEQMKRFEEAGLNPHLMYDKGSGGNQPQMVKPEKAGSPFPRLGNLNIDPLGEMLKYAQVKNIQSQTDKTNTEVQGRRMANQIMLESMQDQIDFYSAKLQGQQARNLTEAERASYTTKLRELTEQKIVYQKELNRMAENGIFQNDPLWSRALHKFGQKVFTPLMNIGVRNPKPIIQGVIDWSKTK